MFRTMIIALAALGIACVGIGSVQNSTNTEQKEQAQKAEKKPRLGYDDPYFPPAKGHGF